MWSVLAYLAKKQRFAASESAMFATVAIDRDGIFEQARIWQHLI
jgi:hypothetical protein